MTVFYVMIILIISVTVAFLIINTEKKHCDELSNVIRMITDIKTDALFSNRSFEKIIYSLNASGKYVSLEFVSSFCRDDSLLSVPLKWKYSVEKSTCKLYQWEKDVLIRLCDSMCICGKFEIEEYCENALSDLRIFLQTAKENKDKITKTRAVFALSTGVMLALLII